MIQYFASLIYIMQHSKMQLLYSTHIKWEKLQAKEPHHYLPQFILSSWDHQFLFLTFLLRNAFPTRC